jgi:4-amino-4-deoxy-L-arabinose transferase-like glycosyltransferase
MIRQQRQNLIAIALGATFFAAVAPTLPMLEFSNGAEGLNVATALEIRRTGNWLVPTLQGETRLAKPPLAAWITAASISRRTLEGIRSADAQVREQAFRRLAWEVRWPALLAACVVLFATFAMMRALPIAGSAGASLSRAELTALCAAGSMLLMLRFCRYATTDIYLALWVAIANAFLALALFQSRWWSGCIGAGIALGFALLSKGPVALVATVVPIAIAAPLCSRSGKPPSRRAIGAGIVVTFIVALPWFGYVLGREPRAWGVWFSEVTRVDATESKPDRWYSYLAIVPYAAPWSVFLIAGLVGAFVAQAKRDNARLVFAATLLVVPLLVMSFFKDRAERYMLPMVPAAAAVCAAAFCDLARAPRALQLAIESLHVLLLAAIAIAFPLAAAWAPGMRWYSHTFGTAVAAAAAGVLVIQILLRRRWRGSIVLTTFLLMLAMQAIFIAGYRNTRQGRAELRPLADAIATRYPDAAIFNAHPDGKRPPPELGVYLARTITWIGDPSSLARDNGRAKVLLMIQRKDAPAPAPPIGWEFVAKSPRDKDVWWAFVLR